MGRELSLAAKDERAVQAFARRLREALGPEVISLKLFGSKATGRAEPDSDLDILVVVREARGDVWDRTLDVAFEVNLAHEVYISPRVVPQAVLDDPVWRASPFLQLAESEGVPL